MKQCFLLPPLLLTACSSPDSNTAVDRFQFVGGSREAIDLVFDRATGCIAEIMRNPTTAELMQGDEFDPTKPFTVEDAPSAAEVPDWAKDPTLIPNPSSAATTTPRPKPSRRRELTDDESVEFHGVVAAFKPWHCPLPASSQVAGVTR